MNETNNVIKLAKSNFKMRLYLLMKLPFAFMAGLRVVDISENEASVSIPYKFLNKNPFQSIYFAALSMAAELSTGLLAMSSISNSGKQVSMLVLEMNAKFTKKAKTKIVFSCLQGQEIAETVNKCITSKVGETLNVCSKGVDIEGNEVAEFNFVWTFRLK